MPRRLRRTRRVLRLEGGVSDDLPGFCSPARRGTIAVYDIKPGLIETEMTRAVNDTYQRRVAEEGLTLTPRIGKPEDVGKMIASLATGALPYSTGHAISVDGGMMVPRF